MQGRWSNCLQVSVPWRAVHVHGLNGRLPRFLCPVVRKNSIRAIGAEYEHESHGMMSA